MTFQGKEITLENLSPVFTPEQEAAKRRELEQQLAKMAELTVEAISPEQVSQISGYLDTWENVSFDDKRRVVDLMITAVPLCSPL